MYPIQNLVLIFLEGAILIWAALLSQVDV